MKYILLLAIITLTGCTAAHTAQVASSSFCTVDSSLLDEGTLRMSGNCELAITSYEDEQPFVCPAETDYVAVDDSVWSSSIAETSAETSLVFEFYAKPSTVAVNGGIAIDDSPISVWGTTTALVRFSDRGEIDVWDGGQGPQGYGCLGACPTYAADTWYRFVASLDLVSQSYSVEYAPCGEPLQVLHDGAPFRNPAQTLSNHAAFAINGSLEIDRVSWTPVGPSPCVPDSDSVTCGSQECGTATNNCGETVSCGSCGTGESCVSGLCVAPTGEWWETVAKPNSSNTGPSNPGALRSLGSCPTINNNGTIIENFSCSGRITVNASNVTLRNFSVDASGDWYGVLVNGSTDGLLMEYGEISGAGASCIRGMGWTGKYLDIYDCDDGLKPDVRDTGTPAGDVVLMYSYIHDLTGGHGDGIQSFEIGNNSLLFQYNTIYGGNTAAFWIDSGATSTKPEYRIENNWLGHNLGASSKDGYTVYCEPVTKVYNNLFTRNTTGTWGIRYENNCDWKGNLWEDTLTEAP